MSDHIDINNRDEFISHIEALCKYCGVYHNPLREGIDYNYTDEKCKNCRVNELYKMAIKEMSIKYGTSYI